MEKETNYLEDFRVIGKLEESTKELFDLNNRLSMFFSTIGGVQNNINMTLTIFKKHYNLLLESLNFSFYNSGDHRTIVKDILDKLKDAKEKDDNMDITLNGEEIFNALRVIKYYHAVLSMALRYRQENAGIIYSEEDVNSSVIDSLDN